MQSKRNRPELDPAKVAEGIGKIVKGPGYVRVVVDGKTIAYLKRASVAVPAALVVKAPKKLAIFKVEANGRWAGASVESVQKARAILEHVARKAGAR
jgi:hypothetical protein